MFFFLFSLFIIAGPPLRVEINMQVRSMGPISEVDMVSDLLVLQLLCSEATSVSQVRAYTYYKRTYKWVQLP